MKRENQNTHDEFMAMLKGFLRTGDEIGVAFSQNIKDMYPDSLKGMRGSRDSE